MTLRTFFQVDCRSRFLKHEMTGSPIFSINLTNRKNPSNLNYHMSIKKSQAILKRKEREKRKEEKGKRKLKKVPSVTKHGFVFRNLLII